MKFDCHAMIDFYRPFARKNGPFLDDYLAFNPIWRKTSMNHRLESLSIMAGNNNTTIYNIFKLLMKVKDNEITNTEK